jgi:hypothetical protein
MINHSYRQVNIILNQEDFDRALAEMSEGEFKIAWAYLGRFVRARAKRIKKLWEVQ